MTALAYIFVEPNGQETSPPLNVMDEDSDALYWFADMASIRTTSALTRPGFLDLQRFARRGDILIISSLNRLGSERAEIRAVLRAMKAMGLAVLSVAEGLELFGPDKEAIRSLLGNSWGARNAAP